MKIGGFLFLEKIFTNYIKKQFNLIMDIIQQNNF